MEINLGFEITDEELISMDPELLIKLQKFLKEHRLHKNMSLDLHNKNVNNNELFNYELNITNTWVSNKASTVFEEVEDKEGKYLGIKITQDNRSYIARNWRINSKLKEIVELSASCDLTKLWRNNHPSKRYYLDKTFNDYIKGSHHIGFSHTHDHRWVFVLGAESLSRRTGGQIIKFVTFNKIYYDQLNDCLTEVNLVPSSGQFCKQNFGGKDLLILPEDLEKVLLHLKKINNWKM